MVELIVVIVLIGVIGTVAVSRFFERSAFDTAAWAQQVKATLRHAQKVAIAQNQSVFVHFTPDRVAVCLERDPAACTSDAVRVRAPGGANSASAATRAACASGTWMCEGRPEGVTMTLPGKAPATGAVVFDGMGRAAMIGGFGGRLVIADKNEGQVNTVAVEAETGYVD